MKNQDFAEIEKILIKGGVGVFPTDTLYGIVGSAFSKKAVERIYALRKREKNKPMIVLISSLRDLKLFNVALTMKQGEFLQKCWPEKVSVILDCENKKWEYLHRGKKTIAFRFPKDELLIELLKKTGPLVAPSANFAGEKPAESFAEAREYFGEKVDFYVDCGKLKSKPSTLVSLDKKGKVKVLREGAVKIRV